MDAIRLRQNAYHEAGHVVMARLVGIPLEYAEISEKEGSTVLTNKTVEIMTEAILTGVKIREIVFPLVLVLASGIVAEMLINDADRVPGCDGDDEKNALRYLSKIADHAENPIVGYEPQEDYNTAAMCAAKKFREPENMALILKIADALFRHHKLSAAQLNEIR